MRKNLFVKTLAPAVVMLALVSMASAADNWIGVWKLNLAKSKYTPGPAPKSTTLTYVATASGVTLTSDVIGADGKPAKRTYTTTYDGKDVPYTGSPDADSTAAKRIDDHGYEAVAKKGGQATITSRAVVSADGKTLTVTQTGKNGKGETVNNVVVYDRQ